MTTAPSKNWLTPKQAAHALGIQPVTLYGLQVLRRAITTRDIGGGRLLWYRPELEEVRRIKGEIDGSTGGAARTFLALREGRLMPKPEGAT